MHTPSAPPPSTTNGNGTIDSRGQAEHQQHPNSNSAHKDTEPNMEIAYLDDADAGKLDEVSFDFFVYYFSAHEII